MHPIDHPKSLTEVTAAKIRNAIISGELPLGSKLSEQRLADTLGVSRSPVRDALAALQSEGLVRVSPKRGSFVFTPDLRDVDELCEHRAVLETAALRMGINRNHAHLLEQMDRAVRAMDRALAGSDAIGYSTGDRQFHRAIIEGCGNRSLIKAYNHTISPVKALRTHLFTIMDEDTDRSMRQHVAILAACRSGDADLAVTLLEEHIGHLTAAFRIKLSLEAKTKAAG